MRKRDRCNDATHAQICKVAVLQEQTVADCVLLIAGAGRNHPDRQGDLTSNFGGV